MDPDASQSRQLAVAFNPYRIKNAKSSVASNPEESLECILQPRVWTDFSYREQPIKCYISLGGKRLACNGKNACIMVPQSSSKDSMDQFFLLPQANGTVVFQNTKTQRFLCSASNGKVYASSTKEQWIMTQLSDNPRSYSIASLAHPNRRLVCRGNTLETSTSINNSNNTSVETGWTMDFLSGEICFLRHPMANQQIQCNLVGNLSMTKNFPGWAGWRFSEEGDGCVRISSWVHSEYYLSSSLDGQVSVSQERGLAELWKVERAPHGLVGVLIKAVRTGRVLHYNLQLDEFLAVPGAAFHQLDESCVWDLQSLHRRTYYLVTGSHGRRRRLEACKRGVQTRRLPGRLATEEWTIVPTNKSGVVHLFSNKRQQYLASNALGKVFLVAALNGYQEAWVLEERDEGVVVRSEATGRVLVSNDQGPISTVEPGARVVGNTRWKLEPKLPPQISKTKVKAVMATALAVGVAGTISMPILVGGIIGALGMAKVGVAGDVAIGSIRAVEARNTFTRVTLSSSQLMISQSSIRSSNSSGKHHFENAVTSNRPFCAWRSW